MSDVPLISVLGSYGGDQFITAMSAFRQTVEQQSTDAGAKKRGMSGDAAGAALPSRVSQIGIRYP